jgi:hypothetical protein
MRFKVVFQGALALAAALAVVGGGALAVLGTLDPDLPSLRRLETGYRHAMFGFGCLAVFAVASVLIDFLAAKREAAPAPAPAAAPAPAPLPAPPKPAASRLAGLYHEMKTFVDLEMWELALEKANLIVKDFAGTPEADLVSKNLSELRWKAEPKFVAQGTPMSAVQEKELKEKGLAQMCQHVKTYMELEMWELARQKAITILRNFPDSPEANELARHFETLERKIRETSGSPEPTPS